MIDKPQIAIYDEFDKVPKEFDVNWIKAQGTVPIKQIQLYIHGEPILRIGCMYHKALLKKTLNEYKLDFKVGSLPARASQEGPLMIGDNYKLVGTGRISHWYAETIKLWDYSAHYGIQENDFLPANLDHLLKLGFKINRKNIDNGFHPSFLVTLEKNKKEEIKTASGIILKSNLSNEGEEINF